MSSISSFEEGRYKTTHILNWPGIINAEESRAGQKYRKIIIGWRTDYARALMGQRLIADRQKSSPPSVTVHGHLCILSPSYLLASPRTLGERLLRIESLEFRYSFSETRRGHELLNF
jgi:hypothetical protein